VQSLDTNQLKGKVRSASQIRGGGCKPLDVDPVTGLPYYPCGLIANSVFNGCLLLPSLYVRLNVDENKHPTDTFDQPVLITPAGGGSPVTYNMTDSGISWPGESKYYGKSAYANNECVPPPYWSEKFPGGYTDQNPIPDLSVDEHFQVWMRTAGLPTFRKLFYRNDDEAMNPGRYQIAVYPSTCLSSRSHLNHCF
jgi:hypothetical protein